MNKNRRKIRDAAIHNLKSLRGMANSIQKHVEEMYDGESDLMDRLESWSGTERFQKVESNVDALQHCVESIEEILNLVDGMLEDLGEVD